MVVVAGPARPSPHARSQSIAIRFDRDFISSSRAAGLGAACFLATARLKWLNLQPGQVKSDSRGKSDGRPCASQGPQGPVAEVPAWQWTVMQRGEGAGTVTSTIRLDICDDHERARFRLPSPAAAGGSDSYSDSGSDSDSGSELPECHSGRA